MKGGGMKKGRKERSGRRGHTMQRSAGSDNIHLHSTPTHIYKKEERMDLVLGLARWRRWGEVPPVMKRMRTPCPTGTVSNSNFKHKASHNTHTHIIPILSVHTISVVVLMNPCARLVVRLP
jgi:hypothetical protein